MRLPFIGTAFFKTQSRNRLGLFLCRKLSHDGMSVVIRASYFVPSETTK